MSAVPQPIPLRALVYTRVSHDKRKTGRSVAEQLAESLADCDRAGWQVVATLEDNDRSASRHATKQRQDWTEAKRLIASGAVDVLVTWTASRAQRDLAAYVELRGLCERHGVLWRYDGNTYDFANRTDRLRTGFDALIAEDYAEQGRDATLRAVRANAAAGKPHGRKVYGYERSYDPTTGAWTGTQAVNDAEAAVIREAAQRFLAGESTWAIAQDFNRRGIRRPSGKAWTIGTVRSVLTNPAHAGIRVHRGEQVAGNWPAIHDGKTWAALCARFADPARRTNRDRRDLTHLLSGVARCGKCGGRMERQANTRGRPSYVCRNGGHVGRAQDDLDAFVTEEVLQRLEQPDLLTALLEAGDDPDTDAARARVAELQQQLDDATEQFLAKQLSAALLGKIEARLLPQIEAAERQARQASPVPQTLLDAAGPGARDQWDQWEQAGDVARMRDVVRALVEIAVLPVGRGRKAFDRDAVRLEFKF